MEYLLQLEQCSMVTLECDRTTVPAYAAATKWSKNSSEIDSASSNCRQKILQAILAICYSLHMMRKRLAMISLLMLSGCSTTSGPVSNGATLLSGLNDYQGEMQHAGNSPERWPDRQRAGGELKGIITATVGGSREFYRLVDLDIRKREFVITMRDLSLRTDRTQEMKDELVAMDEEILALKPIVREQVATMPAAGESRQQVETVATYGMLKLAVDKFSSSGGRGIDPPSTWVDQNLVTDLGSFSTVRTLDGQIYHCSLYSIPEQGAGMKCELIK